MGISDRTTYETVVHDSEDSERPLTMSLLCFSYERSTMRDL